MPFYHAPLCDFFVDNVSISQPECKVYSIIKEEETTPANATRLQWVWDTYYKDSEIVKMDIADIDVIVMKEWFLKTVREHQLTSKKYKDMKSLANMILEHNRCNGLESGFLFLDENGGRLHDFAVNNVLRRGNKQIGTAQKGNHSIRKTCISSMIASKQLTNEEM